MVQTIINKIDGTPRFNWNIWQPTECGDNPNISQGGTWLMQEKDVHDKVKEYEFELTLMLLQEIQLVSTMMLMTSHQMIKDKAVEII